MSSARSLAFANAFSAKRFVPGDPPPELFEIDYVRATEDLLVPPEKDPTFGGPAVAWLKVVPKGASSTRLEEALVIGAEIRARADAGTPFRDVAVLATTNGMLDAVSFALAQADIPYVVAGKSFFRAREIADLAAMLALVLEPHDRIAALEVLRGPWTAVRDETLLGLVEPGKGIVSPSRWRGAADAGAHRGARTTPLRSRRVGALVAVRSRASAGRLGPGTILRARRSRRSSSRRSSALCRAGEQRVANVREAPPRALPIASHGRARSVPRLAG